MKKVTMLAFDDASSTTIISPMDVIHLTGSAWNQLHGAAPASCFEAKAVSPTRIPVRCMNGLSINVSLAMHDVEQTGLVIIFAMLHIEENLIKQQVVISWLRQKIIVLSQDEAGQKKYKLSVGPFVPSLMVNGGSCQDSLYGR